MGGGSLAAQPLDHSAIRDELLRMAAICDTLGMAAEAETCREWLPPSRSDWNVFYLPIEAVRVGPEEHPQRANWAERFSAVRKRYAQGLFALAEQHAAGGDEARAFQLLWQVLREDGEHADAKRLLGPLLTAVTVAPRLRKATTPHPDFGWPAGSYSRIETPNFVLTTRADPRASLELARLMERFYAVWRQLFYPLWSPPGILTKKFSGQALPWERTRGMSIVLLRDRDEYLQVLGIGEANAGVSVGYYAPQRQTSFFYPAAESALTLYHELTHQLLAEATYGDSAARGTLTGGVWLMEGIAMYMESLVDRGGYWTVGGNDAPRLQTARYRAIRDRYWVDWSPFVDGQVEQWKQDPQIALLYAQAAGLTHMFMDDLAQPAARQRLLASLMGIYQNQTEFSPLLPLLGSDPAGAQAAYQRALTLDDQDVQQLAAAALPCRSLVLAGSQLSADSWNELQKLTAKLEWFDVSLSNATSADLLWLPQAQALKRLSVEATRCDGELVKKAAQLPELQELDLSGCPVDDQALLPLAGHRQLHTLWLTGTSVTQASFDLLRQLPNLKFCHVEGTQISDEAWEQFRATHPRLSLDAADGS